MALRVTEKVFIGENPILARQLDSVDKSGGGGTIPMSQSQKGYT